LRDSGLLHKLLNISDLNGLLSHPILSASWEGFVAENIIVTLSDKWQYSYYRTTTQTEVDLVPEGPDQQVLAIEIKRSAAPTLSKGFHVACEDIGATHKYVVYSGTERFRMSGNTEAVGLIEFLTLLQNDHPLTSRPS
jgi:predicted AAA+ superfamily ATPase